MSNRVSNRVSMSNDLETRLFFGAILFFLRVLFSENVETRCDKISIHPSATKKVMKSIRWMKNIGIITLL